ncbi:hypothetical protein CRUP_016710 [Coryphaenoides rupestris]|nr:hypothetical protein CRUP_016710 [Coryphaenoides rupestris]
MASCAPDQNTTHGDGILEALCFPEQPPGGPGGTGPGPGAVDLGPGGADPDQVLVCPLCPQTAPLSETDRLLEHLLLGHKMVVADVKLVADLPKYMSYWKGRFLDQPITEYCSVIKTNSEGPVDNIVYCRQLLDLLQRKLDSLQCLYCEKAFRDKTTLRDHMRKKSHRRINARNRDDWSDWQARPVCAVCLFCEQQEDTMDRMYTHMEETHGFHLQQLKTRLNLRFYQQVKLVNFIRREIHQCRCYGCQEKFGSKEEVLQHIMAAGHVMKLPAVSVWDQPQYFFPTYENDGLLCVLSDSEEGEEGEGPEDAREVPVIAEDISDLQALRQTSVLNQLLKKPNPPLTRTRSGVLLGRGHVPPGPAQRHLLDGGAKLQGAEGLRQTAPLSETDRLLEHLLLGHKMVVADVKLVADLPKYMSYWKGRFLDQPITEYCSVIKTNSEGPRNKSSTSCCVMYFLKTGCSENSFSRRDCVGLPDNIVYCRQLLDLLQRKLDSAVSNGWSSPDLRFYQQVKLVNFIRREIHQCRCYGLPEKFGSKEEVLQHIMAAGHVMKLPAVSVWDQPQLRPCYATTGCRVFRSDKRGRGGGGGARRTPGRCRVIAEDISDLQALRQTQPSLNQLLKETLTLP